MTLNMTYTQSQIGPWDCLQRCGRWLMSLDREDAKYLEYTPEFRRFIRAMQQLEVLHSNGLSLTTTTTSLAAEQRQFSSFQSTSDIDSDDYYGDDLDSNTETDKELLPDSHICSPRPPFSFLHRIAADDVVLRIFEFLECGSLVRAGQTCQRFRHLAHKSATQRTRRFVRERSLNNIMELLRAKEQMDSYCISPAARSVRIPILLLSRRVVVTEAGDPDYNGIYYCTGCNGNGFVFTKPRACQTRVLSPITTHQNSHEGLLGLTASRHTNGGETLSQGRFLRCIIAKRFSNETILWYLSKELVATDEEETNARQVQPGNVTQVYAFWATLMVAGEATSDICRYPSQTSILTRHNRSEGWQSLSTTRTVQPPVVELLD